MDWFGQIASSLLVGPLRRFVETNNNISEDITKKGQFSQILNILSHLSLPGQLRIDPGSSSHNVSALVGKRAVLSCTVRNLNNHSVSILPVFVFVFVLIVVVFGFVLVVVFVCLVFQLSSWDKYTNSHFCDNDFDIGELQSFDLKINHDLGQHPQSL